MINQMLADATVQVTAVTVPLSVAVTMIGTMLTTAGAALIWIQSGFTRVERQIMAVEQHVREHRVPVVRFDQLEDRVRALEVTR